MIGGSTQPKLLGPFKGTLILPLLGGSWVVIFGGISPLIWVVISMVILLITLYITTHEPPSRPETLNP